MDADIEMAARTSRYVLSMPQGDGVALDEFTNGGADGLGKMVARSQSIGAGKEVVLLDTMTS